MIQKNSIVTNLIAALQTDDEYRMTWEANIAMAFYEEWRCSHKDKDTIVIAQLAAKNFIGNLIDDTEKK